MIRWGVRGAALSPLVLTNRVPTVSPHTHSLRQQAGLKPFSFRQVGLHDEPEDIPAVDYGQATGAGSQTVQFGLF